MKNKRVVIILSLLAIASLVGSYALFNGGKPQADNENEKVEPVRTETVDERIERRRARGVELFKTAPAFGTDEWQKWYENLSEDDAWAYAIAGDDLLLPAEPTAAQVSGAKVGPFSEKPGTAFFPGKILTGYRPFLRMPEGIGVLALQIETVHGANGLITTIWGNRGKGGIVVDWGKNTVSKANLQNDVTHASQSLSSGDSPLYWQLGTIGKGRFLFKTGDQKWVHLPWLRKTRATGLAAKENYRYAFAVEIDDEKRAATGLVVLDTQEIKIAGTIPIHAPGGVSCIFKPSENYLLVVESTWQWIILFDLSKPNPDAPVPDAPRIEKKPASPGGAARYRLTRDRPYPIPSILKPRKS